MNWISVWDWMPQCFEPVLLHMPSEDQPVAEGYWGPDDNWYCYGIRGRRIEVTHWMPMPEPPLNNT